LLLHHNPSEEVVELGLKELSWAIAQYEHEDVISPFSNTQVYRGVFWLGQRNLVLGNYLKVLPQSEWTDSLVEEFHQNSESLHSEFLKSPTSHLDTYPRRCWPADNITALVSLHVHDQLFETDYISSFEEWKKWTLGNLDGQTQLPAGHLNSVTGNLLQSSRGFGNSWILGLLPSIDPELSAVWYKRYIEHHMISRLGFWMFREYPEGVTRHADVDSGPIIWGAGVTATGVGLAASLANSDFRTAQDIHGLATAIGCKRTFRSDKGLGTQYLFGELPVGDAFLTWAYTLPSSPTPFLKPASFGKLLWQRKLVILIFLFLTYGLYLNGRAVFSRKAKFNQASES
jgi:hypothetical protein